jgi:hypothetical protein
LLEETLVIWGGEFGRTPSVELPNPLIGLQPSDKQGRDHNHHGFSMWLAGGGVKGGYVHGATDEFGWRGIENRVHVHDLHATILHLLDRRARERHPGNHSLRSSSIGSFGAGLLAGKKISVSSRARMWAEAGQSGYSFPATAG